MPNLCVKVSWEVMGRSLRLSKEGHKKANEQFKRRRWTQDYLAGRVESTRQTIHKFLARGYVEKRIFEAICSQLELTVGEVADFESEEGQLNTSVSVSASKEPSLVTPTQMPLILPGGTVLNQTVLAFRTGWHFGEFMFILPLPMDNDSENTRYDNFVEAVEVIYNTYCTFIGKSKVTKDIEQILDEARNHNLFHKNSKAIQPIREKILYLFDLKEKVERDLLYALPSDIGIYFQIGFYLSKVTHVIGTGEQSYIDIVIENIDPLEDLTSRTNLPNYLKENLQSFLVYIRSQEFSNTEVLERGQSLGSSILSYLLTK